MPPAPGILELAAIAHQLWCAGMLAEGWRHAPDYDEVQRTHDAIVPFECLGPLDQSTALFAIESLDLPRHLVEAIRYDRGPERCFTLSELRVGLQVTWSCWLQTQPDLWITGRERGMVLGWTTDPAGAQVHALSVQWDSGEISWHVNSERELRRLESPHAQEPPHGCGTA